MRKQILSGLIAAVALLFSIIAVTAGPAASQDYGSGGLDVAVVDPVACGGPISGTVSGGVAPYTVTVSFPSGAAFSTTLASAGDYAFPINAAIVPAGAVTYSVTVADLDGRIATAAVAANISYACSSTTTTTTTGTTGVATTTTGTTTTGTTGVVTAVDFGFTGNGIPNNPSIAVTGTDSDVLGFIATGLIALGAVALGSRRKFLQGALED